MMPLSLPTSAPRRRRMADPHDADFWASLLEASSTRGAHAIARVGDDVRAVTAYFRLQDDQAVRLARSVRACEQLLSALCGVREG